MKAVLLAGLASLVMAGAAGDFEAARRLVQAGRWADAARAFQAIADADPRSPWAPSALYQAGYSLERLGKKEGAVETYRALQRRYPAHEMADFADRRIAEIERAPVASSASGPAAVGAPPAVAGAPSSAAAAPRTGSTRRPAAPTSSARYPSLPSSAGAPSWPRPPSTSGAAEATDRISFPDRPQWPSDAPVAPDPAAAPAAPAAAPATEFPPRFPSAPASRSVAPPRTPAGTPQAGFPSGRRPASRAAEAPMSATPSPGPAASPRPPIVDPLAGYLESAHPTPSAHSQPPAVRPAPVAPVAVPQAPSEPMSEAGYQPVAWNLPRTATPTKPILPPPAAGTPSVTPPIRPAGEPPPIVEPAAIPEPAFAPPQVVTPVSAGELEAWDISAPAPIRPPTVPEASAMEYASPTGGLAPVDLPWTRQPRIGLGAAPPPAVEEAPPAMLLSPLGGRSPVVLPGAAGGASAIGGPATVVAPGRRIEAPQARLIGAGDAPVPLLPVELPTAPAGTGADPAGPAPESARSRLGRATGYRRIGLFDTAEGEYRAAIEANPEDPVPYNNLADMLVEQGRVEEAIALVDQALALDPPDRGPYLDTLGWAYYKKGEHDMAVETLTESLTHGVTGGRLYHVGAALAAKGDKAAARGYLEKASVYTEDALLLERIRRLLNEVRP